LSGSDDRGELLQSLIKTGLNKHPFIENTGCPCQFFVHGPIADRRARTPSKIVGDLTDPQSNKHAQDDATDLSQEFTCSFT